MKNSILTKRIFTITNYTFAISLKWIICQNVHVVLLLFSVSISVISCVDYPVPDCDFEDRDKYYSDQYLGAHKNIVPYKGGDTIVFTHIPTGNIARFYGSPIDTGLNIYQKYDQDDCRGNVYVTNSERLYMKFVSPDYKDSIQLTRYIPSYYLSSATGGLSEIEIKFHKYYFNSESGYPIRLPNDLLDSLTIQGKTYYDVVVFNSSGGTAHIFYNTEVGIIKIVFSQKYGTFERIP